MKQKISGWLLFLLAFGFFSLQMGYLLLHAKFQLEFADNRLFYVINIFIVLFLALSLLLLLKLSNNMRLLFASIVIIFITINLALLFINNGKIYNVTSVSPNFQHALSIKVVPETGKAVYYRTYYGIFARSKETLPYKTTGDFKVKWLTNDAAAITYRAEDQTIHQYISTYGDRGNGSSYYYVAPEIQGTWSAKNIQVISEPNGITITDNGKNKTYEWKDIVQFGTLAIVLLENNQAQWTIALAENFKVDSASSTPQTGDIILYQATMTENKQIVLHHQ